MRVWTGFVMAVIWIAPVFGQANGSSSDVHKAPSATRTSHKLAHNPPITWSLGYLGLVLPSAPNDTVLQWTADTVECGSQIRSPWFHMRNFGTEAIQLCGPVEPESPYFSVETNCTCFNAILPGDMSPCSLQVTFTPNAAGLSLDTMRIETDAFNGWGGYVRIPLSGLSSTTPDAPNMVISIVGTDAHLYWNRVSHSVNGCPTTVTGYEVFYSPTDNGTYQLLTFTSDTSFVHPRVTMDIGGLFYHVVARIAPGGNLIDPAGGGGPDETRNLER